MSRSRKKAIYKDKGIGKKLYRRIIRRVQKYFLRLGKDVPDKRIIVNDYDYCDYISDGEYGDRKVYDYEKLKRK